MMEISYDPRYNIAYIRFRKKTKGVTTFRVSNEVNIDISPNGKIYGIELLNANEQLMKGKKFIFTNELSGKTIEIPLGR
jgi:uncharacterized protein YuzE